MIELIKKLNDILPSSDKKRIVILLAMMLVTAGFEVLGIGVILAFVSSLTQPETILNHKLLSPILTGLGITGSRELLLYGSFVLIGVFLLKGAYLTFLEYLMSRFVNNKFKNVAIQLFNRYMRAPYTFHLDSNSAELVRNVTVETMLFMTQILVPLLSALKEGILIVIVTIFLFIAEPLVTLAAIVLLGGIGELLIVTLKKSEKSFGKQSFENRAEMIRRVNEGLGGIKEISVMNRQAWFIKEFARSAESYVQAEIYNRLSGSIFKPVIENVTVVGLLGITLLLFRQGRTVESIIPTLTLFGVAAFQLMPAFVKLSQQINKLRYYGHSLTPIHTDLLSLDRDFKLRRTKATERNQISFNREITLTNLTYTYPNTDKPVITNINITILKGETIGLIGRSGAGKTTLVDLILGLLKPDKGRILVDGTDIWQNLPAWQKILGYIPQSIYLSDDTIRRNIAFGIDEDRIDNERVREVITLAQLESFIDNLPRGVETMVGERGVRISGGQRQRIGIARALYHDPQVLVMDEATASLDTETESYIIKAVEQLSRDRTVISIAHRLTTVKNCNILYVLEEGRVTDVGKYKEIVKRNPFTALDISDQ